ncbi:MAG: GTPase Era [Deltaproteobacteria bacterium]|jgi:GTP-binding protein Era|nr:GTPase Era [Deltaproteobacteria bacterium]
MSDSHCGFVAIVGAPNSGKSTLLNRLIGEKVAITAAKPQTTRHRILGVLTEPPGQLIFWDTPGLHISEKLLNQEMMSLTKSSLADSDVVLWVVDGYKRGLDHRLAQEMIQTLKKPVVVGINKTDKFDAEGKIGLEKLARELVFNDGASMLISAKTGLGLFRLKSELYSRLPSQKPLYPPDTLTDQPLRSLAAELVREAVFRLTSQEIPYATAVSIEEFKEPDERGFYFINATIHVEKPNQKKMIIGQGGQTLKNIGQAARLNLEKLVDSRVFLRLFVRVTKDWSKKSKDIKAFGYGDY